MRQSKLFSVVRPAGCLLGVTIYKEITMTTTTATNKAPRAYMGTTSKHLVVLAEAERDAAKLTNMLTYASEKYAHVKENHPTPLS